MDLIEKIKLIEQKLSKNNSSNELDNIDNNNDSTTNVINNLKENLESTQIRLLNHVEEIKKILEEYNNSKSNVIKGLSSKKFESENNQSDYYFNANEKQIITKECVNECIYVLPKEKEFKNRNSLLEHLLKDVSFSTLYNIIFAIFLIMIFKHLSFTILLKENADSYSNLITSKYFEEHINNFGLTFQGMIEAIFFVIGISIVTLIQIVFHNFITFKLSKSISIIVIIFMTISNLVSFLIYFKRDFSLSFANKVILAVEVIRNQAKTFSYFYFSFYSLENSKTNIQDVNRRMGILIELQRFFFFNLSPTLIYKPNYDNLNKSCDYGIVFKSLINTGMSFVLSFLLYGFSFSQFYINLRKNVNNEMNENDSLLQMFFHFTLHSFLIFHLLMYGYGNCYLIATSELLHFSDRMFFDSFWDSYTPLIFCKKSCLIFYELIHYAIKPFFYSFMNEHLCKICLYLLPCFIMEYAVFFTLNVVYPICSFCFILGVIVSYLMVNFCKSDKNNILTLLFISFGLGLIVFSLFKRVNVG